MIKIYCKGNHKNVLKDDERLCEECRSLADYVHERILKCPFMKEKTFCSMCRVHCYKSEQRKKIKMVMKYSGIRMLKYHPLIALKHLVLTVKQKIKVKFAS